MKEGAEARPSGRRCSVPGGMWAGLASFPSPAHNPLPSPLLALSPGLPSALFSSPGRARIAIRPTYGHQGELRSHQMQAKQGTRGWGGQRRVG